MTDRPPELRNRRVTDIQDGLLDTAAQALRLQKVQHDHELLSQRVSSAMENMSHSMASVQLEVRGCTTKVTELTELKGSYDSSQLSIGEVKSSINALNDKLQSFVEDFNEKNDRRWDVHDSNRDRWRTRHEVENEATKKDLEREIRTVRETVIRALGWGLGSGGLVTVVAAGFLWSLNDRFISTNRAIDNGAVSDNLIRTQADAQREKMHEIELYLARGGVNRADPYVTKQQQTPKEAPNGADKRHQP